MSRRSPAELRAGDWAPCERVANTQHRFAAIFDIPPKAIEVMPRSIERLAPFIERVGEIGLSAKETKDIRATFSSRAKRLM